MEITARLAITGERFVFEITRDDTVLSVKLRVIDLAKLKLKPEAVSLSLSRESQTCMFDDDTAALQGLGLGSGEEILIELKHLPVKLYDYGGASRSVTRIVISPCGSRIYAAGDDAAVDVWNTQSGAHTKTLRWVPDPNLFALSPSGDALYMMTHIKGCLEVRDTSTWRLRLIDLPTAEVCTAISMAPSGKVLYVTAASGIISVDISSIDQPGGAAVRHLALQEAGALTSLVVSLDSSMLYAVHGEQSLHAYRVPAAGDSLTLAASVGVGSVTSVQLSPCGRFLYSLGGLQVAVWEACSSSAGGSAQLLLTGIVDCERLPDMLHAYTMFLKCIAVSPSGRYLYCAGWGISVWDIATYECVGMLKIGGFVRSIDACGDCVVYVTSPTPDHGRPGYIHVAERTQLSSVPVCNVEETGFVVHDSFSLTGSNLTGKTEKFTQRREVCRRKKKRHDPCCVA